MLLSYARQRRAFGLFLVILLSSTRYGFVRGFTSISLRQVTSIQTNNGVTVEELINNNECHRKSLFRTKLVDTSGRREKKCGLMAVSPSFWWILGHVTLPLTGTPTVIKSTKEGGWYRKIDLPSWTPPDKIFGPVWTFLYTCMGVAISRIAKLSSLPASQNHLIQLWGLHFALNLTWAPVFFGLQRFRLGLVISYLLLASLAVIIPLFHAVDPIAAYVLIPYTLWLSFATFGLNRSICRRNPTKNGYNEGMFQVQLQKLKDDAAAYAGV